MLRATRQPEGSFATDVHAAITIDTIAGDPVAAADITAADRVGGFDVTGTVTDVEDGRPVTVTLNGEPFEAMLASAAPAARSLCRSRNQVPERP